MKTIFSTRFKEVLSLSREEAIRLHSEVIGTEHLLLALRRQGAVSQDMEVGIAAAGGPGAGEGSGDGPGKAMIFQKTGLFGFFRRKPIGIRLSRQAEKAIREAVAEARHRQGQAVEPADLVLSIAKLGGDQGL